MSLSGHARRVCFAVSIVMVMFSLCSVSVTVEAALPESQLQALHQLFTSTGAAATWTNSAGWGNTTLNPCDDFYGITCDENDTTVTTIALPENGLEGTLPDVFGAFPNLTSVSFRDNYKVTGALPGSLLGGANLMNADLRGLGCKGTPVPDTLKFATKLLILKLSNNGHTGMFPEIGSALLTELHLNDNNFLGLPESLCVAQSSLVLLSAEANNVGMSPLPSCFYKPGALSSIERLRLSNNNITSPLPSLESWTTLRAVRLYFNHFQGTLPDAFHSHKMLQEVVLEHNQISGPVPASIFTLPNLRVLALGANPLNQAIESLALPNMTSAAWSVNFINSGLTGSIPKTFQALCRQGPMDIKLQGNPGIACPRPGWLTQCVVDGGYPVFSMDPCQ